MHVHMQQQQQQLKERDALRTGKDVRALMTRLLRAPAVDRACSARPRHALGEQLIQVTGSSFIRADTIRTFIRLTF
jgi:hypothetical protein